ncbi:hypothetical protein [Streptomyces sp. HD]|uniref:hypothetical protein n=1 Tax=Streptomyces sp. HD TaxID=3020892 RepID=UPI00232D177C|nr:hypothetical protein [Streptomyces sp. HD]MDC0769267.1 hypothetical protein [Streptomyces sp. HD]
MAIADPGELALHNKALNARTSAACYGRAAKELIGQAIVPITPSSHRASTRGASFDSRAPESVDVKSISAPPLPAHTSISL